MKTQKNPMLLSGFANPVMHSQQTFRAILEAMSHPGRIVSLPVLPESPSPLYGSSAAICLTLLDLDTPLWLDSAARSPQVIAHLQFHCGCPIVEDRRNAAFALIAKGEDLPTLDSFCLGNPLYPELAATLIIQVGSLSTEPGWNLTGPGISTESHILAEGLSQSFKTSFQANRRMFPQGVDVLLVSPESVCGLPRTVSIEG